LCNINTAEIYLVNQDLLSIRRSRLLTPGALAELHAQLGSPRGHEVGSALVLLAIRQDANVSTIAPAGQPEHRNAALCAPPRLSLSLTLQDRATLDTLLAFAIQQMRTTSASWTRQAALARLQTSPSSFPCSNAQMPACPQFYHFRELTTNRLLTSSLCAGTITSRAPWESAGGA